MSRKKLGDLITSPEKRSFGGRLRLCIQSKQITQKDLAKQAGVSEPTITQYLKGEMYPRAIVLLRLSRIFPIDPVYLLTGTGPLFDEENVYRSMQGLKKLLPPPITDEQRAILKELAELLDIRGETKESGDESVFCDIPVVGVAAGGAPIVNGYGEIDVVKIPVAIKKSLPPGEYEAAWCKGDSMEPLIRDGALVIYRKELVDIKKPNLHRIYVINVRSEEGVTIKRLRYRERTGDVYLVPINQEHDIQIYHASEVRVLGVVIGKVWEGI